jgi:flagellar protein FliS
MTRPTYAAQHYFQTQVRSSTPLELVVMMYDAAMRFTATAHDAMLRRDIPTRRVALSKAIAIVSELQSSLDLEGGGAVARELDGLYAFVVARLTDATVRQSAEPIDEARRVLDTLSGAWRAIAVSPPASPPAAIGPRP